MGMSFRKSMKVGRMRVNFSKSGIGVSTGIKGLRVGINSKGQSYISTGTHGMYYRKNLSSATKANYQAQLTNRPSHSSNAGCLLWSISIICCFIGVAYPVCFAVPCIIFVLFIIHKIHLSSIKKMLTTYIEKINITIDSNDFTALPPIIEEMQKKVADKQSAIQIYESTYRHLLDKALEDNNLSENERKVIEVYKSKISPDIMHEIHSHVIDEIVSEIINDGEVTDTENTYLNKVISVLSVNHAKIKEIKAIIDETKKIDTIRKNGLKVIALKNEITDGKDCYYSNTIEMLKIRQTKGEQYYEKEADADIYISKETIDLVANGHKKIKMKDIISAELKHDIIEIIVMNRKKPICLRSLEPSLIIAIIGEIKKNYQSQL